MKKYIDVGVVSLDQHWEDKYRNFEMCHEYTRKATKYECNLVVFPEMTLTGFSMDVNNIGEQYNESESVQKFSILSAEYNIDIICGIVFINEEGFGINSALHFNNNGDVVGRYDKIHPFSFGEENQYYVGGNTPVISRNEKTNIGHTICYDLRFPELFQYLSKSADVIINIANWPSKREDHWRTLLKARAIENQVFMVGVNRTGQDPNNFYSMNSRVFRPNGQEAVPIIEFDLFQQFRLELNEVNKNRSEFPTKLDRKEELYKALL